MTGTQIKALAETHVDDTIEDADALLWLNECQIEDLGVDARVLESAEIVVTSTTTWYDLPVDFLAMNEIETSTGAEYTGSYKIRGGKIRFSTTGTFTLWYYKIPAELTALTETPEAHILLHRPLALFLAARFKSMDDDENPDAARLMRDYEHKKNHALYQIDNPRLDGTAAIKEVMW